MKIGYARVSTADQSLDLQIDALVAAGVDRRHIFTDQVSGKRNAREGLQKARAFASPGDEFIVWRLDRAGRSMSHLVQLVTDLSEAGIGFRSLTENIETTTPAGRMTLHVFASIAEFERELIRERIVAGQAAAKARGRPAPGRPSVIPPGTLDAAETWLDKGTPIKQVCAMFGLKRTTLLGALEKRKQERAAV